MCCLRVLHVLRARTRAMRYEGMGTLCSKKKVRSPAGGGAGAGAPAGHAAAGTADMRAVSASGTVTAAVYLPQRNTHFSDLGSGSKHVATQGAD